MKYHQISPTKTHLQLNQKRETPKPLVIVPASCPNDVPPGSKGSSGAERFRDWQFSWKITWKASQFPLSQTQTRWRQLPQQPGNNWPWQHGHSKRKASTHGVTRWDKTRRQEATVAPDNKLLWEDQKEIVRNLGLGQDLALPCPKRMQHVHRQKKTKHNKAKKETRSAQFCLHLWNRSFGCTLKVHQSHVRKIDFLP